MTGGVGYDGRAPLPAAAAAPSPPVAAAGCDILLLPLPPLLEMLRVQPNDLWLMIALLAGTEARGVQSIQERHSRSFQVRL